MYLKAGEFGLLQCSTPAHKTVVRFPAAARSSPLLSSGPGPRPSPTSAPMPRLMM